VPKPQGTYLQSQKIVKIALRARRSKIASSLESVAARRAYLKRLDTFAARNIAYRAHDQGVAASVQGHVVRRALSDLVDNLNDMADELAELAETSAELREPVFEFRAVTHGQQGVTASNVLSIAMAVITLLMVLEKYATGKRGHRV